METIIRIDTGLEYVVPPNFPLEDFVEDLLKLKSRFGGLNPRVSVEFVPENKKEGYYYHISADKTRGDYVSITPTDDPRD